MSGEALAALIRDRERLLQEVKVLDAEHKDLIREAEAAARSCQYVGTKLRAKRDEQHRTEQAIGALNGNLVEAILGPVVADS